MSGIIGVSPDMRSGVLGAWPSGHVVQVVSTPLNDKFTVSPGSAWDNIDELYLTITPSSSSNKILLQTTIQGQAQQGYWCYFGINRTIGGSSELIGIGEPRDARTRASAGGMEATEYGVESGAFSFLDSPSTTSSITYSVQVIGNDYIYINRNRDDGNYAMSPSLTSTITAMEITG